MNARITYALIGATLLGVGLFWWFRRDTHPEAPVATIRVERGTVRQTAEANGTIEPHVQVEVKSEVAGEIIEVHVSEGDTVAAGDVLFRIDRRVAERSLEEARVTLRRARAELAQARANVAVAEAQQDDAEASRQLSERSAARGLVSDEADRSARTAAAVARATLQQREAAVLAASASVASARLAVQDAAQQLGETEIVAPMAGTVLDVAVERGSIVASATGLSGGTVLGTLADLADLRVLGQIDEAQIAQVEVGQSVEIRVEAYAERIFSGHVERVAPLGVEESNVVTFAVEIVIDDPERDRLRSGMSADLSIIVGEEAGVLVPLTAVRSDGPRRLVQLASGEERAVESGATDGHRLVITGGLAEGDEIRVTPSGGATVAPEANRGLFAPPPRPGGNRSKMR